MHDNHSWITCYCYCGVRVCHSPFATHTHKEVEK